MILSPYILAVLMINHVSVYTPTAQSYSSFNHATTNALTDGIRTNGNVAE